MKNFLCFIGRHWFNDVFLHKLREYRFLAYTHQIPKSFQFVSDILDRSFQYDLPEGGDVSPDVLLVDNIFWNACERQLGPKAIRSFIRSMSSNGSIPVVGIDHGDVILSKFKSSAVDGFDMILKAHGIPKDRDLMNWEIGVRWGLNRSKKIRPVSNPEWRYTSQQLEKFKLSFDMGILYCDRQFHSLPSFFEPIDIFFVGSFNSLNRLVGLDICKRVFRTIGWLTRLNAEHPIVGLEEGLDKNKLSKEGILYLRRRESERLHDQYCHLFGNMIPPKLYRILAAFSKIMPAFSGIGELGPRHYQALAFGKTLLCEDLSHIETLFPFRDGENCIFVSDKLENLVEKVQWLLRDPLQRKLIAKEGYHRFKSCYENGDKLFHDYFLRYFGPSFTNSQHLPSGSACDVESVANTS